jgi:hypothetical protein
MATGDGDFATVSEVRRISGIAATEISDIDVGGMITDAEAKIPRFFNTFFKVTERIEINDGDGTNRHHLEKNPVLSVRELKVDGTALDVSDLEIQKDSGYIFIGSGSDTPTFKFGRNSVVVKYLHGSVVISQTVGTTSSEDEVAGTAISVAVASSTDFAGEDWVEIFGMDGNREAAQISSVTDGTNIVLDKLVLTHEAGSSIVKLEIEHTFTELMNTVCAIACVARIIGQSYTDIVGYTLAELHVQKGEPYTQWRETANQLIRIRDEMMARISIRPAVF